MTNDDVPSGFLLESHGNIKESCSRNDNRTLICELAQFAVGIKATTRVRAKSNWKGLRLVLEFDPDGKTSPHSIASLAKVSWNLFCTGIFALYTLRISVPVWDTKMETWYSPISDVVTI